MLSSYERWITVFDFLIQPKHPASPDIAFSDVVKRIEKLYQEGKAVRLYSNQTRAFRVSDFQHDESQGLLVLLIQLSDKNATDPAFAHLQTGSLRVEPKLAGEGIAVACHLMIKTKTLKNSKDLYLGLLENVPGISRSTLEPFFNYILKESFEGVDFKNPTTRSVCKLYPTVKFIHHASKKLKELLSGSKMQQIRLVSTSVANEMDKEPYALVIEKAMKIKVVKQPSANEKMPFIQRMRAWGSNKGFNKLLISYSKEGKQDTIELDRDEDAASKLFGKSERIRLSDSIGQCEEEIHSEMLSKMKELMIKEFK